MVSMIKIYIFINNKFMLDSNDLIFIEGKPDVQQYLNLRSLVGWHILSIPRANNSLDNSLFIIHVVKNNELIAFGRVVGDGYMYFYIQDIIVHPDYQRKGIGTKIMENIMIFLEISAPKKCGAFIGLMIANGLLGFYSRFGFVEFNSLTPSMKIWRKGE